MKIYIEVESQTKIDRRYSNTVMNLGNNPPRIYYICIHIQRTLRNLIGSFKTHIKYFITQILYKLYLMPLNSVSISKLQ